MDTMTPGSKDEGRRVSENRRWFVSFWHDYEPLLQVSEPGRWNWIDWTLVQVTFERANYCERDEMNLALLGFHVCVERWRKPVSKELPKESDPT